MPASETNVVSEMVAAAAAAADAADATVAEAVCAAVDDALGAEDKLAQVIAESVVGCDPQEQEEEKKKVDDSDGESTQAYSPSSPPAPAEKEPASPASPSSPPPSYSLVSPGYSPNSPKASPLRKRKPATPSSELAVPVDSPRAKKRARADAAATTSDGNSS
jgi:hypothetical protein